MKRINMGGGKSILKNEAFTLIELLAVIVILAIIALIAVPIVLNIIDNTKKSAEKRSKEMYLRTVEIAIANQNLIGDFNPSTCTVKNDGNLNCDVGELKVEVKGQKPKEGGTITFNDGEIVSNTLEFENGENSDKGYIDETGAVVELINGLTPVVYEDSNWKIADTSTKWYDYETQEWANAVILNSGVTKSVGDTLDVANEVKGMFVYVPRYEYKIEGTYGTHLNGTVGTQELPGEIKVNFINKNKQEASSGYKIHSGFKFDNKNLNGIWIGKFMTSGTLNDPTILPNSSYLESNLSGEFISSQKFNKYIVNGDSHLSKDSEYGAAAYLSQSKYGKYGNSLYIGANKEIYDKYTGIPASNDETISTSCAYNDLVNRGNGIGSCGGGASTTGNITGIYEMSGYNEYTMGINKSDNGEIFVGHDLEYNSGFEGKLVDGTMVSGVKFPDSKYYDLYDYGESNEMYETSGWYKDYFYKDMKNSNYWHVHGGFTVFAGPAGVGTFGYADTPGHAAGYYFRIVLTKI